MQRGHLEIFWGSVRTAAIIGTSVRRPAAMILAGIGVLATKIGWEGRIANANSHRSTVAAGSDRVETCSPGRVVLASAGECYPVAARTGFVAGHSSARLEFPPDRKSTRLNSSHL